jgi:hypothetical protein
MNSIGKGGYMGKVIILFSALLVSCVTPGYYNSFAQGFNQGFYGQQYQQPQTKTLHCTSNVIGSTTYTNCY